MKRWIDPEVMWSLLGLFAVLCQATGLAALVALFLIMCGAV
jgi:hypothetical protein